MTLFSSMIESAEDISINLNFWYKNHYKILIKNLVLKKESLFHRQDFSYKVGLMTLQTQEIIMADTETSMYSIKLLVIYFFYIFSQLLLKRFPLVGKETSIISFNLLVTI